MERTNLKPHFVTFGGNHCHYIEGMIFTGDCVATFQAASHLEGRMIAFGLFGPKFCMEYHGTPPEMGFFPRGLVEIPDRLTEEEGNHHINGGTL